MAKSRIGPFALEAPLSKSKSSGQVFRGIHLEQRKLAAIRVFPIPMGMTPESRAAFASQLEQLKQLRHPGIVRCYGGGFDQHYAFLAYELIDGESLESLLARRTRLPWETVLDYAQQLAAGLQYASQMGWVHGRLQPSKVLISKQTTAQLTDWRRDAISSMIDAPRSIEELLCTAPEILDGGEPDGKSDLYSLGMLMYIMLTGAAPFLGSDPSVVISQIQAGQIPSVASQVLDCPVWLNLIVEQLLAREPSQRPYSLAALQLAFKEALRRQSEGVGVLQHAAAGFSPLQVKGTGREEAEKVLGIKPKKKRRQRETSFWESAWFLSAAFLLAIATAVWLMSPPSEPKLRSRAENLLASDKWLDWNQARDEYLQQILERFPDGRNAEWAEERIEWINAREAERRLDRDERFGKRDDWTQAQVQYAEARRFERFGDLASALDRFRAIINLFGESSEDRPIVVLATEGVERMREKGLTDSSLQDFIQAKIDEAEAAFENARTADAKLKLESIIELYGNNQEVSSLVAAAIQRLDEINRKD